MIGLEFKPWRRFVALYDKAVVAKYLDETGDVAEREFRAGMNAPKSGRMGRYRRASSPGDFPASQSGALIKSIEHETHGADSMNIGTDTPYAGYLRYGTRRMAARRMSPDALMLAMPQTRSELKSYARFKRG
jgi:phage gpG-like protein